MHKPARSSRIFLAPLLLLVSLLVACGADTAPTISSATSTGGTAISGTGSGKQARELTVFAAASLTDAFEEIGKNLEAANPGARVTFNFAGSQQLAQQLAQGAPADVFASASGKQMEAVIDSGQIKKDARRPFVKNKLIVIYPNANPAGIKDLKDLARKGVKVALAAKEAPAGQYSLDFLAAAAKDPAYGEAFKPGVLDNIVSYEENVKAVAGKVSLGEADAGIVYESDVASDTGKLGRIEIPEAVNQIATYPIASLRGSKNPDLARKFVDYVLSARGQDVLKEYGFIPLRGG